ncbi:MAG: glycosyltransferase family 4 protein [Verrucomicrobiota bacterium]
MKKLVQPKPVFYDPGMNSPGNKERYSLVYVAGKDPLAEVSGGHSSYVRAHARAARHTGFNPRIFCLSSEEGTVETDYGRVHRIRSSLSRTLNIDFPNSIHGSQYPFHRHSFIRGISQWLSRQDKPVLVHGFGIWAEAGIAAARLSGRRKNTRLISSLYTMVNQEYKSKMIGAENYGFKRLLICLAQLALCRTCLAKLEKSAFTGSDLTLVNYRRVKSLLEREYGPDSNCRIVPYCSERAFIDCQSVRSVLPDLPQPLIPGKPLIVCVSRHDPRKGLDVLCNALAALQKKGNRFNAVLIGIGPLLKNTRRHIRDLGLTDCVSCPGYIKDIGPLLQKCDIYVLPSREEQSGSVSLLEAMQKGKCCIASGVDGMLEDVRDGSNGILVPPGDAAALSNGLKILLDHPDMRKELGQAARKTYEERFSTEVLVRTLADIYSEHSRQLQRNHIHP